MPGLHNKGIILLFCKNYFNKKHLTLTNFTIFYFLSAKMLVQMHLRRKLDTLCSLQRTDPSLCWFFKNVLKKQ